MVMLRLFVSSQPFHRHGSGVGVGKCWKPAGRPCTWWPHHLVSTVVLACQVCILSVTQQNRTGVNMLILLWQQNRTNVNVLLWQQNRTSINVLLWHNKTGQVLPCWTVMPVCYNTTKQDRCYCVGQWCLFAMTQQNQCKNMLDSSAPLQWYNKTGQVLTCWTLMPVCYDITKQYKRWCVRQWCLFAMNNTTGQVLNATQTCFSLQADGEDSGMRGRGREQRRAQLWCQPLLGSWGQGHCAGIPFSCDGPLSLLSTSATQTTHSYNISTNPVKL